MTSEQGDSSPIRENPNAIHQDQQLNLSATVDKQGHVIPPIEPDVVEPPQDTHFSGMDRFSQIVRRFSPVLVPLPYAILIFLFTLPFTFKGESYLPPVPLAVMLIALVIMQGSLLYYAGSNDTYWTLFVIIGYSLLTVVGTLALFGFVASLLLLIILIMSGTILARRSILQVPDGYVDIVMMGGTYARTLYPGPNLKMPLEKVGNRINTKDITWTSPEQVVKISRDEDVKLIATISYKLLPEDAHLAALQVDNWEAALQKLFVATTQNLINGLTMVDFAGQSDSIYVKSTSHFSSKDGAPVIRWVNINGMLERRVQEQVEHWGVQVNFVRIQDITVNQAYLTNKQRLQALLCYSYGDKLAVRELYRRLQTSSIKPWLDEEELLPGQDWQQEIAKVVRTSDVVIVCLSQYSFTKGNSLQEDIEFVLKVVDERPGEAFLVLPVRLEKCNIPERLKRWQWIDLFEEQGNERLLRTLNLRADQVFGDYYWKTFQETLSQTLIIEGLVDQSVFPGIPIIHVESVLKRYMSEHPDSDLEYQEKPLRLHLNTAARVQRIQSLLKPLIHDVADGSLNKNLNEFDERIEKLLREFSSSIGLGAVKKQSLKDFTVFLLETGIAFENIRVPNPLPLLVNDDYEISEVSIEHLRRLLVSGQLGSGNRVALLIHFCDKHHLSSEKRRIANKLNAYAYDIAIINHEDLLESASAKEPERIFRRIVLSQISLEAISPYTVTGPTPINFFFGREHELREITERVATASYILIGGRRIGKTSILKRLSNVLPEIGFHALYHDCAISATQPELVQALCKNKNWFPNPYLSAETSFSEVIQALAGNRPLVILLDEADKLIAPDREVGYPIFNTLRAMINAGQCQFVLSGEQALRTEITNPNSPLYNFANEILIGRLDFQAVQELIIRPMKQLEIELIDEAVMVQHIWEFTSGHPNVVQRLCQRLVKRLNQNQARHLTLDDIEAVVTDSDFIRKDFLDVYWERATSLERLSSLIMANNCDIRTLTEVHEALIRYNLDVTLNQVDEALERLVDLRNILQRTSEGYEFAVTAFPEIIAKARKFDNLIKLNLEILSKT